MSLFGRTYKTTPEPPLASRLLDNSLEYLILVWRGLSVLGTVGWAASFVVAMATPKAWLVCLAFGVVGVLFGWLGFWQFGNPEWRKPPALQGRAGDDEVH